MPVKDKTSKKKAPATIPLASKKTTSSKVQTAYGKKHSKTSLVSGTDDIHLLSAVTVWLDTGDSFLNGVLGDPKLGIPGGRIIELYSAESQGKTTIALWLLGLAQRAGGLAIYADIEGSYDEEWAALQGVDVEELLVLQLEDEIIEKKGKDPDIVPEGMEDLFAKIHSIARICKREDPEMPVIIAWDSVAGTPTKKELDGEYGDEGYALQARALSKGLRKLYGELRGSGVILLCINQTRALIGAWRPMQETPGGKALKFYSSIRAQVQRMSKTEKFINCKLYNRKNKMSPPFTSVDLRIDFTKGLSWGKISTKKKP